MFQMPDNGAVWLAVCPVIRGSVHLVEMSTPGIAYIGWKIVFFCYWNFINILWYSTKENLTEFDMKLICMDFS